MRLENVIALTHGELVNSPFVHTFTNIVFDAKNVKRGDLFIAYDEHTIEDAIFNGAYGIIFDKPTQISDSEIAWIKVKNLDDALLRLLRFRLIDKKITVYECDSITLELATQLVTDNSFIPIVGDIKTVFPRLESIAEDATVLFSPTDTTVDIFTKLHPLPTPQSTLITVVEQTLFETSFIYENIYYERQLLSPLFIPYLEKLLYLLSTCKINFRLKKFTPLKHFEAIFVNKKFERKEFGTTENVLIFEPTPSFAQEEISFLQNNAAWAELLYILPKDLYQKEHNEHYCYYTHENEIRTLLKKNPFHFALLVGVTPTFLDTPLVEKKQMTLFDF